MTKEQALKTIIQQNEHLLELFKTADFGGSEYDDTELKSLINNNIEIINRLEDNQVEYLELNNNTVSTIFNELKDKNIIDTCKKYKIIYNNNIYDITKYENGYFKCISINSDYNNSYKLSILNFSNTNISYNNCDSTYLCANVDNSITSLNRILGITGSNTFNSFANSLFYLGDNYKDFYSLTSHVKEFDQNRLVNRNNLNGIAQCLGEQDIYDTDLALKELGENYQSLFKLATTVKTFLEATDTSDTTINTWKEIETFLAGINDSDSLLNLLMNLEDRIDNIETNITVHVYSESQLNNLKENGTYIIFKNAVDGGYSMPNLCQVYKDSAANNVVNQEYFDIRQGVHKIRTFNNNTWSDWTYIKVNGEYIKDNSISLNKLDSTITNIIPDIKYFTINNNSSTEEKTALSTEICNYINETKNYNNIILNVNDSLYTIDVVYYDSNGNCEYIRSTIKIEPGGYDWSYLIGYWVTIQNNTIELNSENINIKFNIPDNSITKSKFNTSTGLFTTYMNTDVDNLIETGIYNIYSYYNHEWCPSILAVSIWTETKIMQTWYDTNNGTKIRYRNNGVWGDWIIINSGDTTENTINIQGELSISNTDGTNNLSLMNDLTGNGIYLIKCYDYNNTTVYSILTNNYNSNTKAYRKVFFDPKINTFRYFVKNNDVISKDWEIGTIGTNIINNNSITLDKLTNDVKNKLIDNHISFNLNENISNINNFYFNHVDESNNILDKLAKSFNDSINNIWHIKSYDNIAEFKFEHYHYDTTTPYLIFSNVNWSTLNKTYYKITFGNTIADCTIETKHINYIDAV